MRSDKYSYKINVENGLYIGDLCYVLADSVYHDQWGKLHNYDNGAYTDSATGLQFAMVNTAYGDGLYMGDNGMAYPVDAGIIGVCDLKLCEKNPHECGSVVKNYKGEVEIAYYAGHVYVEYGNELITIDTEDDYDEEALTKITKGLYDPLFDEADDDDDDAVDY